MLRRHNSRNKGMRITEWAGEGIRVVIPVTSHGDVGEVRYEMK